MQTKANTKKDVTPRPTDSTGEFEDCSDKVEELCRSELKKCLRVLEEQALLKGLDLTYTEHPVKILETSERVTRQAECNGVTTLKR